MKRLGLALLSTLLACTALAQTTVRITGYGGQDPAIVNRLINEVIGSDLEGEGITVQYEPIEGDYNAGLLTHCQQALRATSFTSPARPRPAS